MKISDSVPHFYHHLLSDILNREIPSEPFSDCSDCPLICNSIDEIGKDQSKPFSPETKCCTFSPRIPNYMVGAILSDQDPLIDEGKKRIISAIRSRKGIFPNGVYPTKKYKLLYESARNDSFGRSKTLQCPYYISGEFNCTIWKYREAICALWFCKHIAGNKGFIFWNTLIEFMKSIQESLILYCFNQLNVPFYEPYKDALLSYEELENLPMKESSYNNIWNEWVGKEEEFYIKCFEIVNQMSPEFFKSLMGIDYEIGKAKVLEALNQMIEIPDYLIRSDGFLQKSVEGMYNIEFYHYVERIDSSIAYSFSIPSFVIDSFDGKTKTSEIIEIIQRNHSVIIESEILIALYQHEILKKA